MGQKYTRAFGLEISNEKGERAYPIMGCYGLGITRTMGVIVEKYHDDKGIVWPKAVAPFDVHLIELPGGNGKKVYEDLEKEGIDVLWDDRDVPAGEKFADADLIGIPIRLVVSQKSGDKVEWKERTSEKIELLMVEQVVAKLHPSS